MIRIDEDSTREDLIEDARYRSLRLGRYAAVVEVTTYLGGRVRYTVMVSTEPIRSAQRGGQFIGVGAQFKDGEPWGDGPAIRPKVEPMTIDEDGDVLPF